MQTFMVGAEGVEIFLMSLIVAVVLALWALRAAFWLMQDAGRGTALPVAVRPLAIRAGVMGGKMVLARVRASQGQMSLRTR